MSRIGKSLGGLAAVAIAAATPFRATAGSKFVEQAIAAVPVPAEGEFATPESVVRAFVDALNRNDQDAAMKCFVIREYFASVPFSVEAEYTSVLNGRTMFPGLDAFQFSKGLEGFLTNWAFFNVIRTDQHEKVRRFRQGAVLLVDDGPAERQKKIAEFEGAFREAMKPSYTLVSSKVHQADELDAISKAVGATAYDVVETKLKVVDLELGEVMFGVVKLGSNWRILNVTGLTAYMSRLPPVRR